jgi:hypothetical protein
MVKKVSLLVALLMFILVMFSFSWAATSSYKVMWGPVTDPDVTEVRIFMSETQGVYDFSDTNPTTVIVTMPVAEGTVTQIPNGTWYFLPVPYAGTLQGGLCIQDNELTETFLEAPACLSNVTGQKQ